MSDEYYTPKYVWEDIKEYIPKNKIIWEAFRGDGKSADNLKEMGFTVECYDEDFFDNNHGEIIITNPPFSIKKAVLKQLKDLDKPFIILCPSSMLNTQYMRNTFKDKIQVIIPKKRINFIHEGEVTKGCNFDCLYYCYKMELPKDIVWL